MSLRTSTLIASSDSAVMIACFHSIGAGASMEAINRVPRFTPAAPSISAAAITMKIQTYKVDRGWPWRDPISGKWKDLFKRGFADNAIGEELNESSVAVEFERAVRINGETHPGIKWELVSKPPGSRVTGFALMRERLIAAKP